MRLAALLLLLAAPVAAQQDTITIRVPLPAQVPATVNVSPPNVTVTMPDSVLRALIADGTASQINVEIQASAQTTTSVWFDRGFKTAGLGLLAWAIWSYRGKDYSHYVTVNEGDTNVDVDVERDKHHHHHGKGHE